MNTEMALFAIENPAPVLRVSIEGEILLYNKAAEKVFGKDILIQGTWCLISPSFEEHKKQLVENLVYREEFQVQDEYYAFEYKYLEEHSFINIYGFNFTENRRLHKELESLKSSQLKVYKSNTIGELASSMAHEINTPLGSIILSANLIETILFDGEVDIDECISTLKQIEKSSFKIKQIIASLKSFSRDEDLAFSFNSINSILENTEILYLNSLANNEIEYIRDIQSDLDIECNSVQIGQIILNLVNNAKDALRVCSQKLIKLQVHGDASKIHLSVSDSGEGINSKDLKRVLEPFYTTKKDLGGTGLGLSLVNQIIEKHGGSLSLGRSSLGGLEVEVILPRFREIDYAS